MNLAFIGFFLAGMVFTVYGYALGRLAGKKIPKVISNYAYAYICLGIAFFVWAFTSVFPGANNETLSNAVLVGNALILVGTIFMVSLLTHRNKQRNLFSIVAGVVFLFVFMYFRMNYFSPEPFLANGVLIFNTALPIAAILSGIFLVVWLPTNIMVARLVTAHMPDRSLTGVYTVIYGTSTLAALLFMAAKSPAFAVATFIILIGCFALLIYSNFVISKTVPLLPPEPAVPVTPPLAIETPTPETSKPPFKLRNWLALIYVIMLILTFVNPDENLANILFFVMGILGIIAGLGFAVVTIKASSKIENSVLRVFMGLAGLSGGILIFIIAAIAAVIGVLKHLSFGGD